jgi:intracellular multiplication protein IcmD
VNTKVKSINLNWHAICKGIIFLLIASAFFYIGTSFAQDETTGIGEITKRVTGTFEGIAGLMVAVSYVAGIGFVIASLFKFKQHKDNPTQITLGAPLALLIIGIVLVFLPALFGPAGETVFGEGAKTGYPGAGDITLPGKDKGT